MADHNNTQCPWTTFYINALTLMETLHDKTCPPQIKITKFINTAKRRFARSLTKGKECKKQVKKVMHIPQNKQPYHIVSSSKQKDMAINRQSCQPVATSCKNRSPTLHPCIRSKADTREPCQPTSTSCRARSPTPHPHEHDNTCVRMFSESIHKPLHKDNSLHIDTI